MVHPFDLEKNFQDLVSGSNDLERALRDALDTEGLSEGEREKAQVAAAKLTRDILIGILAKIRDLRTSIDRLDEAIREIRSER